jgi:hypothetical protein
MSRARPDVAFDPEERAFAAIRETNQRQNARIAELEAQVAHFQTEYQDEIGRTELIENITTLKAERDRLKAAPPIDFRCACQIAGEIAGECLEQRRCQMRGQPR